LEQRGYIANGDKVADLISHQIYNLISAIVEEIANFYDEDATEVKLEFKEEEIDDDIYQKITPSYIKNRKNIDSAILSDSGIITIALVGELLTIDLKKAWFGFS
jgi:hypothetical protein